MSQQGASPAITQPQQERSRATMERIIAAVMSIAAESGLEDLTVADVARRAGVSVGAIYGRFADKNALVLATQERFLAKIGQDVGRRLAVVVGDGIGQDEAQVVRGVVAAAVHTFAADEQLIAAFSTRARTVPALAERAEQTSRELFEIALEVVRRHRDRLGHPDPELAADVLFRILISTLERRVGAPGFIAGRPLSWDELGDELGRLALAYLGISPGGS